MPETPTPADWANSLRAAGIAVAELGGAQPGDRTMLDALLPAADALRDQRWGAARALAAALRAAAAAAEAGAAATAAMRPRLGRASYLGERVIGVEDGGARAVAIWLRALALHLTG